MTKRSIVLIFGVLFLALAGLQTLIETRAVYSKSFEIVQKKKERNIALMSAIAESLFITKRKDLIEGHLNDAVKVRLIDFYILSYAGEPVATGTIRPLSPQATATLLQVHPPDQMWGFDSSFESESSIRRPAGEVAKGRATESFRFRETDLGSGWRLKVGINLDRDAFFEEQNNLVSDENTRVFLAAALLTLAVFAFVSRDLRAVASRLMRPGAGKASSVRTLSAEAELLQNGLRGFEEEVVRLNEVRRVLSAQVLPSLKTELASGRKPPYEFECSMVRTDINNFSSIFRSYPTDEFLETINRFFVDCSHIISKYDGLIHEFVGDEIIFYLKDENHANSFTAALACAGEIAGAAEKHHQKSLERGAYPFRVKSSIAHGRVRFGPLLDGFSIAGAPLIETTRVLSAVQERDENTIHFDSSHSNRLHGAIFTREAFRANLKGIEGERLILRYEGHAKLLSVLRDEAQRHLALCDYRSESSLSEMIDHALLSGDPGLVLDVNNVIKRIHLTANADELMEVVLGAVEKLSSGSSLTVHAMTHTFLATLVSLLARLSVTEEGLKSHSAWTRLQRLLESSDVRVVANTLETMTYWRWALVRSGVSRERLDRWIDISRVERAMASTSSRVQANALVLMGTIEITRDVVSRLKQGLRSKNKGVVASTRYAVEKISDYYGEVDPVYLRTRVDFGRLIGEKERAA